MQCFPSEGCPESRLINFPINCLFGLLGWMQLQITSHVGCNFRQTFAGRHNVVLSASVLWIFNYIINRWQKLMKLSSQVVCCTLSWVVEGTNPSGNAIHTFGPGHGGSLRERPWQVCTWEAVGTDTMGLGWMWCWFVLLYAWGLFLLAASSPQKELPQKKIYIVWRWSVPVLIPAPEIPKTSVSAEGIRCWFQWRDRLAHIPSGKMGVCQSCNWRLNGFESGVILYIGPMHRKHPPHGRPMHRRLRPSAWRRRRDAVAEVTIRRENMASRGAAYYLYLLSQRLLLYMFW